MSASDRPLQIWDFGVPGQGPPPTPQEVGFKAYNLMRMAALRLPVPPGFVLGTGYCRAVLAGAVDEAELEARVAGHVRRLEEASGRGFGSPRRPLLVSVRSGAAVSMPGMLETVLNVGLCETTLGGLLRLTGNPRLVWDSYARLVRTFAEVVHGCPHEPFAALLDRAVRRDGVDTPAELDGQALAALAGDALAVYRERVGHAFPQDPHRQLMQAITAVFRSWTAEKAVAYRRLHGLDDRAGTAVTVQAMVFGNAGGTSGSGVAFTRDPATGEDRLYMDFLFNAQGEDVVSGRSAVRDSDLAAVLPEVAAELARVRRVLEAEMRDMQEFEFTVEEGRLHLLQTRTGKRTPWAALRIAVDLVGAGRLTPGEGLRLLDGIDLDRLERVRLVGADDGLCLGRAVPAGIGVAVGPIAFDARAAREFAAQGRPAILVRPDIATADIAGIAAAAGVLTAVGGRTSHAAVIARQLDKVCLVGCEGLSVDGEARTCTLWGRRFAEGDVLTLDADGGTVRAGAVSLVRERPDAERTVVAAWRRGDRG
ncbi:PEP/pyruvate-binding domain-containing protein [Azospirillum sp. ST 5-10]|uniref:PEP/pyruvate-binding domain-containing protein n=1 Tax=unclassified Azospirillum TaxID=2630922 RepID=UPI003F4A8527